MHKSLLRISGQVPERAGPGSLHPPKPGSDPGPSSKRKSRDILDLLVRLLVQLALGNHIPKVHLLNAVSDAYDIARDNRRSPR